MSLKRGHSSLVDLGDSAFFLDYPVPLRVLQSCGSTCYPMILLIGIISI